MMAFERIEPFGSLHDEFMHGRAIAANMNIHRDPAKSRVVTPAEVMPALGKSLGVGEAIALKDPKAQAQLIKLHVFGRGRKGKSRGG